MAVQPDELEGLTDAERAVADGLEERIDKQLRERQLVYKDWFDDVREDADNLESRKLILTELRKRYHGWNVAEVSDDLNFTAKPKGQPVQVQEEMLVEALHDDSPVNSAARTRAAAEKDRPIIQTVDRRRFA
jgi:hypothetical protein